MHSEPHILKHSYDILIIFFSHFLGFSQQQQQQQKQQQQPKSIFLKLCQNIAVLNKSLSLFNVLIQHATKSLHHQEDLPCI